jgi:hypothetical protein
MLRPMSIFDDDLKKFEADGALSLPIPDSAGIPITTECEFVIRHMGKAGP